MKFASAVPILITSAIRVSADRTAVVDIDQRIQWTLHGIRRWRSLSPKSPLVICDGSGVDLKSRVQQFAAAGSAIEYLSFNNDFDAVATYGKGRGEGEIVNFALMNSSFLNSADRFCKCTAKLWVENHEDIVRASRSQFSFDYFGRLFPKRLDTRYYLANRLSFEKILANAYLSVNEPLGIDLESAYLKALRNTPMVDFISQVVPLVSGLSGSIGTEYMPSRLHALVKGLRNSLVARRFGDRRVI